MHADSHLEAGGRPVMGLPGSKLTFRASLHVAFAPWKFMAKRGPLLTSQPLAEHPLSSTMERVVRASRDYQHPTLTGVTQRVIQLVTNI